MPKIVDKDEKRAGLIRAATKVFSRDGLAATKMAHVAVEAGVGKGTLYEYFDSKADLFWAVCENLVRWPEESDPFTLHPDQGLGELIGALVESYEASSEFFLVLLDYWSVLLREKAKQGDDIQERAEKLYAYPRRLLRVVVDEGKAKGLFKPEIDSQVVAALVIAGIEGLRSQKIQDPAHIDFDASIAALNQMILDYLKID